MNNKKSSGALANKSGARLENQVAELLESYGYTKVSAREITLLMKSSEKSIYARQVNIGKSIYDKDKKADLLLFHPDKYPNGLVIECKWQAVSGSVEEKYPFETLNIQKHNYLTIIVLDGQGYTEGAKKWLEKQVDNIERLLHVISLGELQQFLAKGKL